VLFEQLALPFYLINKKSIFYSPTPSIPLFAKFLNKKNIFISTIHDMIPFRVENKYSFFRSIYVKILSKKSAQISDKVITVSEFSKKDIAEIAGVELSKIDVIYNFIPELNLVSNTVSEPYFVTVCTIEPGKNIENMILGFKKFITNNYGFEFYKYKIIGQFGWNYNEIIALLKNLKLEGKVEFTGYLSDIEKNNLLKNCTGMIYLSKYEGFGIPPLEAMYFNKISIVSNTSSLPEVVGKAGIVQDPGDTDLLAENLKILINDSESYREHLESQLNKFNPSQQILNFSNILISNTY
jgi:glycosyltransferase involved in cell wall biosynthesis